MQQFAELMASQAVKDYAQQEAHRAAREASGQKAAGPKAPARHLHGKPPPGYSLPPRPDQREPSREEARSCSCDQQHARSCPGYPLPPSFASFLSLKPRETPSSRTKAPKPDRNCLPKDPGAGSVDPGLGLALGMSLEGPAHDPDCPYVPDPGQQLPKRQGQDPARDGGPQQAPSLPCLCFQTCAQFLCQSQAPPADSGLPAPAQSPGPFPCFSCQRSFPTCAQLLRHQQSHGLQEGASQHLCMHCAAAFARPALLLQHQRERHAAEPRGFLCPECGRAFNSHGNLRIHLNVHTGARPYSCADCGKSFSQSGALKIHRRIHTGERPYTCDFCGRGFPHLAGVRAHQRTHTGEKPYRCPQCGKCFTQSGALKIHLRIHTGERPFVCGLCGKGFSNRAGIRFHHRTAHGVVSEASLGLAAATGSVHPGLGLLASAVADPGLALAVSPAASSAASPSLDAGGSPARNGGADAGRPGSSLASGTVSSSLSSPSSTFSPDAAPVPSKGAPKRSAAAGRDRKQLVYACEDCGLRFRDALSRNKHQELEHYPNPEDEGEEEGEEEGVELSPEKEGGMGETVESMIQ